MAAKRRTPKTRAEGVELVEYWDGLKEGLKIPKLTDAKLREFVDDFVSNRIFTLHHIPPGQRQHMARMVFLPVALGAFSQYNPASLEVVGTIYERYEKALPRSISGLPMFTSFHVVHVKDWQRAAKAIEAEEKRRQSIELPPEEL